MIQRVQTLFLLGMFLCGLLLIITNIPYAQIQVLPEVKSLSLGSKYQITFPATGTVKRTLEVNYILLLGSLCLTSILSIFFFKNLDLQRKVVRLAALLSILVIIFPFVRLYLSESTEITILPGIALVLLPLLFAILALRAIRKDKILLASINRIR